MREETKKLKEALEKIEMRFDFIEGKSEEETDVIDFPYSGDLGTYEVRIGVKNGDIEIYSIPIYAVRPEKYGELLETLNYLNNKYRFTKFSAGKNDDEEGYRVIVEADSLYGENYDPGETLELMSLFLQVLEEAYPQIIKAIV